MSALDVALVLLALLVGLGWYLTYTAARLHRLHTRAEGALAAVDAQLVRRAEAVLELVNSGELDPATAWLLAGPAAEALDAGADALTGLDWSETGLADRERVEGELTHVLDAALPSAAEDPAGPAASAAELDPDGAAGRVSDATRRVRVARVIYNSAVDDVRRLRSRPIVRACRLAGRAALPRPLRLDDGSPAQDSHRPEAPGASGADR